MNKLIIIGNLTRDPEIQQVNGMTCCTFTVAVNRRVRAGSHPETEYIRVTAWRKLGDICGQYLAKGRKVAVEGAARACGYNDRKTGDVRAYIQMSADSVEFLSTRSTDNGFEEVADEELPFDR